MLTLTSILRRTVRLHAARVAIRDTDGDLRWADFIEGIARSAGMLARLGVRGGDRYALLCRNRVACAELMHAGYWLGAVPVPLNYRLAPNEIALVLEDAECRLLAIEDTFARLLGEAPLAAWRSRALCIGPTSPELALPGYAELKAAAPAIDPSDPEEEDDAIMLYTGGTTGRGKGVPLSHRNVVANALQLARAMSVDANDLYLHVSPMFHSADLKATALTMMGGAHAFLADFSTQAVLSAIARYRVTIASLVPTMIIRLLQDPELGRHDIRTLRLISYGTSPIAPEWIRRTMQAFPGVDMQQVYGLTETSPVLALLDKDDHRRALAGEEELLRAAGRQVPGADIRIVGDDGRELPTGTVGEIVVRGPQVAKGYHNRPQENAQVFRDGWFYTGDIGRLDAQGYLFVLDRKKDMVVTGGENVYTSEVEAAIYQHPDVHEAAVIGVPDERYGEALFAVIVPVAGRRLSTEQVIAHCRERIGGYKIPRRMVFVDALPKSAMGKILKHELRRSFGGQARGEAGSVAKIDSS